MCYCNSHCCLIIFVIIFAIAFTISVSINMSPPTTPITTIITTGLCNNHLRLASAISDILKTDIVIYYDTVDVAMPRLRARTATIPKYNDYSNYTVNYNLMDVEVDPNWGLTKNITLPYFPSSSIDFGVKQPRYDTLDKRISAYLNLMTLAEVPESKVVKRIGRAIVLAEKPLTPQQQNEAMKMAMTLGFKNLRLSVDHARSVHGSDYATSLPVDIPPRKK
jgi:hypothetical protein